VWGQWESMTLTAPATRGSGGSHRGQSSGAVTKRATRNLTMPSFSTCKSRSGKTHHGRIVCTPTEAVELYERLQAIAQRQHDQKPDRSPAIRTSCTLDRTAGGYLLTFENFKSVDDVWGILTEAEV